MNSKLLISLTICLLLIGVSTLAWAGEFTAFGPEDFIRQTGTPVTVVNNFSVLNPNTEFILQVYNGGLEDTGAELVSSSIISINGTQVLGPEKFNQNVNFIETPVNLQLDNTIEVEVRGKTGGLLTVHIMGKDFGAPNIEITDPPDDSLTNINPYEIKLSFSDDISGINLGSFKISINGTDETDSFNITTTGLPGNASGSVVLSEGTNNINASISDFAGNSSSVSSSFTIDTTLPSISIIEPANGSTITTNTPNILIPYSDLTSGIDTNTFQVSINGLDYTEHFNITDTTGATYQLLSEEALSDGENIIQVTISDRAGNSAIEVSIFRVITILPPPITPESGFIHGRVFDASTEHPLEGASVTAQGIEGTILSDSQGRFAFPTPGTGQFKLTAQKEAYTSAQRLIEVISTLDVNVEPIYLTPLDLETTLITVSEGGIAVNSTGTLVLDFPPDAVPYDLEVKATALESLEDLPAPQQDFLVFLFGASLEPNLTVLNQPAQLKVVNRLNLPPGFKVPLTVWNENTLTWDDAGEGIVADDGAWIKFTITHFSTYHSNLNALSSKAVVISDSKSSTVLEPKKEGVDPVNWIVGYRKGNLYYHYNLPTIRTLGVTESIGLTYNSITASPSFLILNETNQPSSTAPDRLGWSVDIEGIHREIKFAGTAQKSRQAFLWDAKNIKGEIVKTGSYPYTLNISNEFDSGIVNYIDPDKIVRQITVNEPIVFPNNYRGRAAVFNQINSPFGAGWSLTQLQKLHFNPDGTILLTQGDGYNTIFTPGRPNMKKEAFTVKQSIRIFDAVPIFPSPLPSGEHYIFGENTVTVDLKPGQKAIISSTSDGKGGIVVDNYMLINGINKYGLEWFSGVIGSYSEGMPVDTFLGPIPSMDITDLLTVGTNDLTFELVDWGYSGGSTDLFLVIAEPLPFEITDVVSLFDPVPIFGSLLGGQPYSFGTKLAQVNLQPGQAAYISSTADGKGDWIVDNYLSIDGVKVSDGYSRVIGSLQIGAPVESAFEGVPPINITEFIPKGDCLVRFDLMDFGVYAGSSELYLIIGNDRLYISSTTDQSTLMRNEDGTFIRRMKDGTQIKFNSDGLHIQTIDRNQNTTSYTYDEEGRVIYITDPVSRITQFDYDASGRLASITDPAGRITEFYIDGKGELSWIESPDNFTESFTYDFNHLLTSLTDCRGFVTEFIYDEFNRINQVVTPEREIDQDGILVLAEEIRKFQPGETKGLINSIPEGKGTIYNPAEPVFPEDIKDIFIDGKNYTITFKTDEYGSILEQINALGKKTIIERDKNGNPIKITHPNGAIITMSYDARENLLTSTEQSIGATTTFTYESNFNQVTSITDPQGNITRINYDERGNPIRISDALGNATTMTYDSRGLLTGITNALGNQTTFTYDEEGNLISTTDPLNNTTTLIYDDAGNAIASTDAEGKSAQFEYDQMNRLTGVIDAQGNPTHYEYDASGNLTTVIDANNQTTAFEYDSVNQLTKITNPLGFSKTFAYDLNRNLASTTDAKDQTITFTYDRVNQLIQKTLPDELVRFEYDSLGNLILVEDNDSKLVMDYDPVGRLIQVAAGDPTNLSITQPLTTIAYSYDKNGNRLTMTNAQGGVTTYTYDALTRLTSLTNPDNQTTTYGYDQLSRRTSTTLPNSVITTYNYDQASQLTGLINKVNTTTISSFTYAYDKVGNRDIMTDISGPHNYTYDNLNRLTNATHPTIPTESFDYDGVGNRLTSSQYPNWTYDDANRLLSCNGTGFNYEANGNLTSKTDKTSPTDITTYTYNAENQLIKINFPDGTFAQYKYDGLGRRIEKNVNGSITRYIYDNEDILCEYNGSNTLVARYTHGPGIDEPLIMEREGETYYYHTDGLGSITKLTDSIGSIVQTYTYDSFGNIVAQSGSLTNPYTYTGREFDPETGLYYYRARYYSPSLGRFLQTDPIGYWGGINLYTYCSNNPLNWIDPYGLDKEKDKPWWEESLPFIIGGAQWHSDYSRVGEKFIEIFYKGAKFRFDRFGRLVEHTGRVIGKATGKAAKALKYLKNVKPGYFLRGPIIIFIIPPELRADPSSPFYDPESGGGVI